MAVAKKYRLKKDKDIKNVFSKGKTIKNGLFFIKFLENSLTHSRITVVVSKKVSSKAVQRNLVKRRVYAAIEKKYLLKNRTDILIVALPPILGKQMKEIKAEIDGTMNKVFSQ